MKANPLDSLNFVMGCFSPLMGLMLKCFWIIAVVTHFSNPLTKIPLLNSFFFSSCSFWNPGTVGLMGKLNGGCIMGLGPFGGMPVGGITVGGILAGGMPAGGIPGGSPMGLMGYEGLFNCCYMLFVVEIIIA